MGTLVVVLFILQLLSFYFIVILNLKLSKFQDLERKQEQLMREMDDIVGAYLLEMREENDRLISELSKKQQSPNMIANKVEHVQPDMTQPNMVIPFRLQDDIQPVLEKQEPAPSVRELEARTLVSKAVVTKAYAQQKVPANTAMVESKSDRLNVSMIEEKELSLEEQVLKLAEEGQTAEQIAKVMQKGKTEIELLLKFHS